MSIVLPGMDRKFDLFDEEDDGSPALSQLIIQPTGAAGQRTLRLKGVGTNARIHQNPEGPGRTPAFSGLQ